MNYDVFISHASEDKEQIAVPESARNRLSPYSASAE
jgi:hypothetical protein